PRIARIDTNLHEFKRGIRAKNRQGSQERQQFEFEFQSLFLGALGPLAALGASISSSIREDLCQFVRFVALPLHFGESYAWPTSRRMYFWRWTPLLLRNSATLPLNTSALMKSWSSR